MNINVLNDSDIEKCVNIFTPVYNKLKNYHDHHVIFEKTFSLDENYIFVTNHSLATYDILLLMGFFYWQHDYWMRPVIDKTFTKSLFFRKFVALSTAVPKPGYDAVKQVILNGESVLIAPGGMKEALRPYEDKYRVNWDDRLGFARLSMETQRPIVLAACANSDDIYHVKKSKITEICYEKFRLPVPLAHGMNKFFPVIPNRVKLTHMIDGPFYPPACSFSKKNNEERLKDFHKNLCQKMNNLLHCSLEARES